MLVVVLVVGGGGLMVSIEGSDHERASTRRSYNHAHTHAHLRTHTRKQPHLHPHPHPHPHTATATATATPTQACSAYLDVECTTNLKRAVIIVVVCHNLPSFVPFACIPKRDIRTACRAWKVFACAHSCPKCAVTA